MQIIHFTIILKAVLFVFCRFAVQGELNLSGVFQPVFVTQTAEKKENGFNVVNPTVQQMLNQQLEKKNDRDDGSSTRNERWKRKSRSAYRHERRKRRNRHWSDKEDNDLGGMEETDEDVAKSEFNSLSQISEEELISRMEISGIVPSTPSEVVRCAILANYRELKTAFGEQMKGSTLSRVLSVFGKSGIPAKKFKSIVAANAEFSEIASQELKDLIMRFKTYGIPPAVIAKVCGLVPTTESNESSDDEPFDWRTQERRKMHPKARPVKRGAFHLEPIYTKREGTFARFFPYEPQIQGKPSGPHSLLGSSCYEIDTILRSVLRDPNSNIIPQRIDGLPGRLRVTAKGFVIRVMVYPTGDEGNPSARCGVESGLGTLLVPVSYWCNQLFTWMAYTVPETVQNYPQFQVNILMKKELACTVVTADEFKGETIMIHESLWGRIMDLSILLPMSIANILLQWSRVSILQSSPIGNDLRDYLIREYWYSDVSSNAYIRTSRPAFQADKEVLEKAVQLKSSNFYISWPPDFLTTKPYMLGIPICLGLYPKNTVFEYSREDGVRIRQRC